MRRLHLVWSVIAVLCTASVAAAQERDIDTFVGSHRVVKRGSLATMSKQLVPLAGHGSAPAATVASDAFRDHDAFTANLRKGRKGLQADPVVETEVVETEDSTILSTTTRAVVSDPDELRKASPEFATFRSGKHKAKLSDLDAKTKKAFDEFKTRADKFPAGHPLKVAADKGEQALLDAVVDGKGDVAVTTTVSIPKTGLTRDAKGKLVAPKRDNDGSFAVQAMPKGAMTLDPSRSVATSVFEPSPEPVTQGKSTHAASFLTGFTEGDRWEWSRRWDFPTGGFFRVKASAWYAYGLRAPVKVTGTIDPATITMKGGDGDTEYDVALTPAVLDGSSSYYADTGISSSDVHSGNELVLDAGFQVTFTLHILGTDINESLPKNDSFDFSQDFRPPFGDCGTNCGFNVWIPAEITHSSVNILGIIKGSARAGVNVGGDGTAYIDFEAMSGKDVKSSWLKGDKKNAKNKHTLAFHSGSDKKTLTSVSPEIPAGESSMPFGYRLSNPRYDWTVVLTPGVRADVGVKVWPVLDETFSVPPLWIDAAAIKLGTIKLGPHEGSKGTYTVKHGTKKAPLQPSAASVSAPAAGVTKARAAAVPVSH